MRIADETTESIQQPTVTFAQAESAGLLTMLVGDGRPLLALVAIGLILSGIFALFLSITGTFLPHDLSFLGMEPRALCDLHQCRVVHFIFHDRVSFGGTLIAIGTLYLWLLASPLRLGQEWAWWTLLFSGTIGFLSFLAYLFYGYLDSWHAVASAGLLPLFLGGLWKTRSLIASPESWASLLRPGMPLALRTRAAFGRLCLIFVGAGMALAGSVITILGSTIVFVPQDITYLGFTASQLNAINPHLIPLIAHDRAGFGGGLASCGLVVLMILWKARPSLALWQALLVSGCAGFGCAIGVHYKMNYLIPSHLMPAWTGAVIYAVGIICLFPNPPAPSPPAASRSIHASSAQQAS